MAQVWSITDVPTLLNLTTAPVSGVSQKERFLRPILQYESYLVQK